VSGQAPQRILVRAPNWVGDVVMATPAFRALRQHVPDARLVLLCKPYVEPILSGCPWFDELVTYPGRGAGEFLRLVRRLRRERFDLAVILPNSFRTALEARLGGARRRVGYARPGRHRGWLLTDPIAPPLDEQGRFQPQNMVDYYLRLCEHLGCQDLSQREELFITPECQERADALLETYRVGPEKLLIGLNPGGAFGSSKIWPAERFAAVADALATRHDARAILFGSPNERPILKQVATAMDNEPILPEPGELNLDVLKPLVNRCGLLVTNDTGARHFAVALDVPCVTVMGSTSPAYTDVNLERQMVVRVDVDCGPCQQKVCTEDHRCMRLITPDMVLAAAEDLLDRFPS
jgi:heptosyltransferase-2